jgi:hypothetical protein
MKSKDKFYVIKLINRDGTRGYLADKPEGFMVVTGGLHASITQFKTQKEAEKFIKDRKVERQGMKAYIRSNEDLIAEGEDGLISGTSISDNDNCYLENKNGWKLFYDAKQEGYYFDSPDVGYCIWKTEGDAEKFIEAMEFPEKPIIKKMDINTQKS